jgi:hypothetical protein
MIKQSSIKLKYNPESKKLAMIELRPIYNPVPKNQMCWNKLGPKDKHVHNNLKYMNDTIKPVNLR